MVLPQEIIRKKRDGNLLSKEEIEYFVKGLTDNFFSDTQIASMSMAIFLNGMGEDETVYLTEAMTRSGDILQWEEILDSSFICDKHSTGGVGDKVSFLLAPILAACGGYVPMISGRGLGHTGGTLDKFDAIPGYNTQPDINTFKKVVKEVGCAIIGQTDSLAPADKKLYAIRDITSTIESIPLITSSILSKKIAAGLKSLVLDVKVGNGSFNSTVDIAENLARSLVSVAKGSGLKCSAILTDMNQILGRNAGHSLEVVECIEYLTGENKNTRLANITNNLSIELLCMNDKNLSRNNALEKIIQVVENGKAAEKFERMVSLLGGTSNILTTYKKNLQSSAYCEDIYSENDGYVNFVKTRTLGLILIEIGGGRKQISDTIDYSVGYGNVIDIGQQVDKNTPLLTIFAKNKEDVDRVREQICDCFMITDSVVKEQETIYKKIS